MDTQHLQNFRLLLLSSRANKKSLGWNAIIQVKGQNFVMDIFGNTAYPVNFQNLCPQNSYDTISNIYTGSKTVPQKLWVANVLIACTVKFRTSHHFLTPDRATWKWWRWGLRRRLRRHPLALPIFLRNRVSGGPTKKYFQTIPSFYLPFYNVTMKTCKTANHSSSLLSFVMISS